MITTQLQRHSQNKIKISRKNETFRENVSEIREYVRRKAIHTRRTRSRIKHKTQEETFLIYTRNDIQHRHQTD